jgi:hypothetical protein
MLTLRVIASYQRRIMQKLETMPIQLLWLAADLPNVCSKGRLRIAQLLLDTPSNQLHITARKVKYLILQPLIDCVRSGGKLGMVAYAIFKVLADTWTADTQEVEGYMSLIQAAVARAPAIHEAQLDARVGKFRLKFSSF